MDLILAKKYVWVLAGFERVEYPDKFAIILPSGIHSFLRKIGIPYRRPAVGLGLMIVGFFSSETGVTSYIHRNASFLIDQRLTHLLVEQRLMGLYDPRPVTKEMWFEMVNGFDDRYRQTGKPKTLENIKGFI